jgi:hypothetical protein
MAVVKPSDFEFKPHGWRAHATPQDIKDMEDLMGKGAADPYALVEAYDLHDQCFYCHQKLTIPCVFWHGDYHKDRATTICLHPACVDEFCEHLKKDARIAFSE